MDPLSIAAGAIAVLGASGQTVQGLEKVWALRYRSQEFVGLWNQANAIRALLWANEIALKNIKEEERGTSRIQDCLENINILLDQAKDIFATLDKALREVHSQSSGADGKKPSKKNWFRRKAKLAHLTEQASTLVMSLNATLSTLQSVQSSSATHNTTKKIDLVLTKIEALHTADSQGKPTNVLEQVEADIEDASSTAVESSMAEPMISRRTSMESFHSALSSSSDSSGTLVSFSGSLSAESDCDNGFCPCRCHQSSESSLPWWLTKIVGSVTVHGNGSILLNRRPCDKKHCQRNGSARIQVSYVAPAGFLLPAFNFYVNAETKRGLIPSVRLFVPNVIPIRAPVWSIIELGKVVEFKNMLARRETSPRDVSARGTSVLKYAATKGQNEIYSILVSEKADPFFRDESGMMAIQPGIDRVLSGTDLDRNASGTAQRISELYVTSETLEQQGFTLLHLIVLDYQYLDLETQLRYLRNDIDEPDAMGRTPLLWAAWRGDIDSVQLLIKYGADVDKTDTQGWTPLAKACKAGHIDVVDRLVAAGASLTIATLSGMQPIHYASDNKQKGVEIVQFLLKRGADPNKYSKDYGTPLHNAANRGSVKTIQYLLDHGSDINARDSEGYPPYMIALGCWNEAAFKYLAQSGARLDVARNSGHGLLHAMIWFSSTNVWDFVIDLLKAGKLRDINARIDHNGHDIQTCLAKCRGLVYPGPREMETERLKLSQVLEEVDMLF